LLSGEHLPLAREALAYPPKGRSSNWNTRGEAALIARRASWLSRHQKLALGPTPSPTKASTGVAGMQLGASRVPATFVASVPTRSQIPDRHQVGSITPRAFMSKSACGAGISTSASARSCQRSPIRSGAVNAEASGRVPNFGTLNVPVSGLYLLASCGRRAYVIIVSDPTSGAAHAAAQPFR
jgi:hypothetical protein